MADQRASCHPSIQLTINFHQKPLKPPRRAIFLLTFYVKYFSEMKSFGHEREEGCSVLPGCFRDTKFTVYRKTNISHVMSIDSLLFNLDVEFL